jgi:membrane dipeptidase
MAAGAVFPYGLIGQDDIDRLFDQATVVDTLSTAHKWDDVAFKSIKESGYTAIQTTLPSPNLEVAVQALAEWNQRIKSHPDKLVRATRVADIERAKREGKMAVLFGFQNSTMIEDDVDNVDVIYEMGTRCIQLTYNARNLVGDGCTERTQAGLSDFGVAVVERMNELGIIVDLSHCGKGTTRDGIEVSKKPPAFTHTMCEAIYNNHPRAKTDEQMKALSDKGGVMGIAALGYFIGKSPDSNFDDYLNHVDHAVQVMGIDHVGLATDYALRGIKAWATKENWYEPRLKSFKPSYNVRWPPWIPELDEPKRFRNVAHGLHQRGYSTGDIEKVLGMNWLNYFREVFGG